VAIPLTSESARPPPTALIDGDQMSIVELRERPDTAHRVRYATGRPRDHREQSAPNRPAIAARRMASSRSRSCGNRRASSSSSRCCTSCLVPRPRSRHA